MKAAQHIVRMLKERDPKLALDEASLWDVLPAARGLTVILLDGRVLPLPRADGPARQILHGWSVDHRA